MPTESQLRAVRWCLPAAAVALPIALLAAYTAATGGSLAYSPATAPAGAPSARPPEVVATTTSDTDPTQPEPDDRNANAARVDDQVRPGIPQPQPHGPTTVSPTSSPPQPLVDHSVHATTSTTAMPATTMTPVYDIDLPGGPDVAADPVEHDLYLALLGSCDGAKKLLGAPADPRPAPAWNTLNSPANVIIFEAAISACKHNRSEAQSWRDKGTRLFPDTLGNFPEFYNPNPHSNGDAPIMCWIYQSLTAYLDQTPRSPAVCRDAEPAGWAESDDGPIDPRPLDSYPPPTATTPAT